MDTPQAAARLTATPGDVLFSRDRIPYPGNILQGFASKGKNAPDIEPYVSFEKLREFLEFLEYVVLTERMIVPVPFLSKQSERLAYSKRHRFDFVVIHAAGDLDLTEQDIIEKLTDAGVMVEARLDMGETADDTVARYLPSSPTLQSQYAQFVQYQESGTKNALALASAQLAYWIGAPLQIAEAAAQAKVPYVLGRAEEHYMQSFERETLRTRQWVSKALLERLNEGARKELLKLQEYGVMAVFPETPISSMIVRNATSAHDMIDVAIQLRSEFASYRRHLNQIEHELASEDQPLSVRLKRAKELDLFAKSLWPESAKLDMRKTALGVSEAFLDVAEVIASPGLSSMKTISAKLAALPVETIMHIFRKRKIRLLLKAKRQFLHSADMTGRLGEILNVPTDIVRRSKLLKRAQLTSAYAAKHPEIAADWYRKDEAR